MKHLVNILLCLLIVGAGVAVTGGVLLFRDTSPVSAGKPAQVTNVKVQVLESHAVEDLLLLNGRIEPWEEVTIGAEVTGSIEWKGVNEGDVVEKGQELFRIDTTSLQTTYDQALARDRLATEEWKRIENLRRDGIASPQDLDRVRTDRDLAALDTSAAKTRLEKSVVYAPIPGVVNRLYQEAGEFVETGSPLVHLVQVDRVKAIVGVPERDVSRFSVDMPVEIVVDALSGQTFSGTIHRVSTSAETATRTFPTEIVLDNATGVLKPGMTARAKLLRGLFENAIEVPIFSVISLENQRFVAIEKEGAATVRPVTVGRIQGDQVHITEGLAAGDRLIVAGQRDLREGAAVQVVEETP